MNLKVPKKDKYGNKDLELFSQTKQGQEFFSLEPLKIGHKGSKKDIISSISMDISWISMCYNDPLYVYIISDRYYNRNINLGFSSCTHLSRNKYIQEIDVGISQFDGAKIQNYKLSNDKRYKVHLLEDVEVRVKEWIDGVDLKKNAYYCVHWTIKGIFIK